MRTIRFRRVGWSGAVAQRGVRCGLDARSRGRDVAARRTRARPRRGPSGGAFGGESAVPAWAPTRRRFRHVVRSHGRGRDAPHRLLSPPRDVHGGRTGLHERDSLVRRARRAQGGGASNPVLARASSILRRACWRPRTSSLTPPSPAQFSSDFEGGNLGSSKMLSECEYELAVRHDTCAPRHRLWFHFSASNHRPNQKVLFHVVNFSKSKSLYKDGMSPTVRTASQLAWARLHPKNVFYYKSTASRKGHGARASEEYAEIDGARRTKTRTCSPSCTSSRPPPSRTSSATPTPSPTRTSSACSTTSNDAACRTSSDVSCAAASSTDVATSSSSTPPLDARGGGAASLFARKSSVVAAAVDDVIAGKFPSAASLRSWKMRGESSRKVVLVSCRVHPGETPASHALRGFLDFIASDDDEAASLRRAAAFVVVPMLNPDGCALGNYRTDSLGQDLNRAWTAPTRATEPTLEATKRLARRFAEDPAFELVAYVDCHAHTSSRRSFLFCNPPEDASDFEAWERAAALPRLIDARGGGDFGFSLAQCNFAPRRIRRARVDAPSGRCSPKFPRHDSNRRVLHPGDVLLQRSHRAKIVVVGHERRRVLRRVRRRPRPSLRRPRARRQSQSRRDHATRRARRRGKTRPRRRAKIRRRRRRRRRG